MSKKKEPLSKLCYFITSGAERSLNIEARLFKTEPFSLTRLPLSYNTLKNCIERRTIICITNTYILQLSKIKIIRKY